MVAGPQARGFDRLFLSSFAGLFDACTLVVDSAAVYPNHHNTSSDNEDDRDNGNGSIGTPAVASQQQVNAHNDSGLPSTPLVTDLLLQLRVLARTLSSVPRLLDKPFAVMAARQQVRHGDVQAAITSADAASLAGGSVVVLPPFSPILVSYLLRAALSDPATGLDRPTQASLVWRVQGCGGAGARATRWGFDEALSWVCDAARAITHAAATASPLSDDEYEEGGEGEVGHGQGGGYRTRFASESDFADVRGMDTGLVSTSMDAFLSGAGTGTGTGADSTMGSAAAAEGARQGHADTHRDGASSADSHSLSPPSHTTQPVPASTGTGFAAMHEAARR